MADLDDLFADFNSLPISKGAHAFSSIEDAAGSQNRKDPNAQQEGLCQTANDARSTRPLEDGGANAMGGAEVVRTSSPHSAEMTCLQTGISPQGAPISTLILLGPRGAGKTTFRSRLYGLSSDHGDRSLSGGTRVISKHKFALRGRLYHIYDTPGFDDERHLAKLLSDVQEDLISRTDINDCTLLILFFLPINAQRVTGTVRRGMGYLKACVRPELMSGVILATTFWDMLPEGHDAAKAEFELQHSKCFWGTLTDRGAGYERIQESSKALRSQLETLVRRVEGDRTATQERCFKTFLLHHRVPEQASALLLPRMHDQQCLAGDETHLETDTVRSIQSIPTFQDHFSFRAEHTTPVDSVLSSSSMGLVSSANGGSFTFDDVNDHCSALSIKYPSLLPPVGPDISKLWQKNAIPAPWALVEKTCEVCGFPSPYSTAAEQQWFDHHVSECLSQREIHKIQAEEMQESSDSESEYDDSSDASGRNVPYHGKRGHAPRRWERGAQSTFEPGFERPKKKPVSQQKRKPVRSQASSSSTSFLKNLKGVLQEIQDSISDV